MNQLLDEWDRASQARQAFADKTGKWSENLIAFERFMAYRHDYPEVASPHPRIDPGLTERAQRFCDSKLQLWLNRMPAKMRAKVERRFPKPKV